MFLEIFVSTNNGNLSDEILNYLIQYLKDEECSFREYFQIPNKTKLWIKYSFNVNFEEITGLTSEENSLVEISTDRSLKMKFNKNIISNFWLSLLGDHPDL